MKKSNITLISGLVVVVVILIVVILRLTMNNSTLSSSQINADKQQITTNWQTFFAAKTSLQDRENLLQNGSKFTSLMQTEFTSLGAASPKAVISNISVSNSSNATVKYTIDLNNQPVLTDQTGQAVYANNKWLVSDSTLCGLLKLDGLSPAACKGL
jgi:hypothetical protein